MLLFQLLGVRLRQVGGSLWHIALLAVSYEVVSDCAQIARARAEGFSRATGVLTTLCSNAWHGGAAKVILVNLTKNAAVLTAGAQRETEHGPHEL